MPIYNIHLTSPLPTTFRTAQVAGLFDLPADKLENRLAHALTAELPGLDDDWTIGAIVGPSGSGKTTLARAAYGDAVYDPPEWPRDLPIIEALDQIVQARNSELGTRNDLLRAPSSALRASSLTSTLCPLPSLKHLLRTLTAVGLASPPSWLRPYPVLSTGERFRADLARAIMQSPALLVFDEFTSTLDRTTACTASFALAKLLRSTAATPHSEFRNPKFVCLSCHTDFLPWLAPDWVLDLSADQQEFRPHWPRGSLQRPQLRLAVRRVPQALWPRFARHHYLSCGLSTAATCYAAFVGQASRLSEVWDNRDGCPTPVAFCAVLATLGWKRTKHITRLVVLPEFQGLGIGPRLAEAVAEHQTALGHRVTITASHPAIVAWCWRSPRWRFTGLKKHGSTRQRFASRPIRCSTGRAVASFEYLPQ